MELSYSIKGKKFTKEERKPPLGAKKLAESDSIK
jgi:hypothetical protein